MKMYQQIKQAVPVREAAERYGLPVSKSGMARCPFHEDKHPSMKVNKDYFYCFGCHKSGDVTELTARLLNMRSSEAAKRIAADFHLTFQDGEYQTPKGNKYQVFLNNQELCIRALTSYLYLLKDWQEAYEPTNPNAPIDDRYAEACRMLPTVNYLLDCLVVGDFEQRQAMVKELLEKDTISRLREYLWAEIRKLRNSTPIHKQAEQGLENAVLSGMGQR